MPRATPATHIEIHQEVDTMQGGSATALEISQVVGNVILAPIDEAQARRRRNLRLLLDKVKSFWIDGVLQHMVQGAALIELNKLPAPAAVERPLHDLGPAPETDSQDRPSGAGISEVFEQADRALLILDGSGSGKTTSLLELTRDLAGIAEDDPLQPVPVVLNLSSWNHHAGSLVEWVVEELNEKYSIPRKLGRDWLDNNDLALLLDGLDEVQPEQRPACIAALNRFRQDYGLASIAICSRTEDYRSAGVQLRLGEAVILQPLTTEQVEEYLHALGPASSILRQVLQEDADLQNLAQSPLLLNMMRLAYQDLAPDALQTDPLDSLEERRQRLIEVYVERMYSSQALVDFHRPVLESGLGWLSRHMAQNNQAVFLIEHLQPAWLANRFQRWLYWLLSRAFIGAVFGLLIATTAQIGRGWKAGLAYILAATLSALSIGVLDGFHAQRAVVGSSSRPAWFTTTARFVEAALVTGIIHLLIFTFWVRLGVYSLFIGAGMALAFGLLFGLLGSRRSPGVDIQQAEALAWSWAEARKGLLPGLLLAVIEVAVIVGMFSSSNKLIDLLRYGLVIGSMIFLGLVLIYGLRGKSIDARSFPNQGTWLSARNAALAGLLLGGLGGVIYGVNYRFLPGVLMGIRLWILAGLWFGWIDVVKHLILRLILSASRCMPWRLVRFLDEAANLKFLHKAGGGYVFANRLLQEYFAGKF